MKKIIAAIVLVMATGTAAAQWPDTTQRIGLFVGGAYQMHSASFTTLPGMTSCCPEYTTASGLGLYAGVDYSLPLNSQWRLSFRAGYAGVPGTFTEEEFIGYALDGTGDDAKVVKANSEHELITSFSALEVMPRINFRPASDLGLGLHAMLDGQILFGGTYEAKETLISPSGAVFADTRTNVRNQSSGDITNLSSFVLSIGVGVHWDLQLSNTWWLTPEVSYYAGLMDVAPDWKVSSLRAGFALTTALIPSAEEPAAVIPPPTKRTSALLASVRSYALADNDTEQDVATIRIEETLSTQVYPVLPFVFFDDNVSRIKTNTYRNLTPAQTRTFNERTAFTFDNTMANDRAEVTLDVYRNVLNIVGKRMRDEHPQSTLTITGCNSDNGAEKGNTTLSRERAEAVRDYLTSVWGIEAARLTVDARGLPSNASKYTADAADRNDALEENRRVELTSSNAELFFPVVINDTLREISPPKLKFRLAASSDTDILEWQIASEQPGFTFLTDNGRGAPPSNIVWARAGSQKAVPRTDTPITTNLAVSDAGGERFVASDTLAVDYITIQRKKRERIGNYQVDQYRLSLFGYEETDLSALHTTIIDKFIRPSLPANALVRIDGYTDRKGDSALNERLSQQRAEAVAKMLGAFSTPQISGHGEGTTKDPAPFKNDTPEGRMYNRTVNVTILVPAGE